MTLTESTMRVALKQSTTMGMLMQWRGPLEVSVMWSIYLGIDQARRNEGTLLNDDDLETDDDG